MKSDKLKIMALLMIISIAMIAITGCRSKIEPEHTSVTAASYAGSKNCKLCHGPYLPATYDATYHQDWLDSAHGKTANIVPSDASVAADSDDNGTNDFKDGLDLGTMPEWNAYTPGGGASGDFAPLLGYQSEGNIYSVTIGTRNFVVEKVIGSGRAKQACLTRIGGSLYVLPILYIVESKKWIPLTPENWYAWNDADLNEIIDSGEVVIGVIYPTTSETPVSEGRTGDCWERRCSGCHVTGLLSVAKNITGEFTASYIEEGAACEACHGSGHLHASTLGGRNYPNKAIVNPAKLDSERSNDICMSCHSRGSSIGTVNSEHMEFPWKPQGSPFLPGQDLSESFTIAPKEREELHTLQGAVLHGGQAGSKYGTWATGCQDCHSAHNTTNLSSIRMSVPTTFSGDRDVVFITRSGTAGTTGLMGDATDGEYDNICEVCHTRTEYFRNDASSPITTHFNGADCTNCHRHERGFLKPESMGTLDCSSCHDYLSTRMTTATAAYRHFLDDTSTDYPTASSPMRCLSCHADHDIFNPHSGGAGHGANLRVDIAQVPAVGSGYASTDFVNSGSGGICLSCHTATISKSSARPDGSTQVKAIPFEGTPAERTSAYDSSPHGGTYTVQSAYNGSGTNTFNANCTKCHNDNLDPKSGINAQISTLKFGLHVSTNAAMLSTLGAPAGSEPLEEKFCHRCHSQTTDAIGGTAKPAAAKDWYNTATMSGRAEGIFSQQSMPYGHKPGNYTGIHKTIEGESYSWNPAGNRHVECADCHNPHSAGDSRGFDTTGIFAQPTIIGNLTDQTPLAGAWGIDVAAWPSAWTTPDPASAYTKIEPVQYTWQVCLKCHSGYAYNTTPPSGQTDQALEFNPNNPGYHAVIGASKTTYPPNTSFVSPWTKDSTMNCFDCHTSSDKNSSQGPHGSANEHIIAAVFDTSTGNAGTQGHLCFKCHSFNVYGEDGSAGASATGFSRGSNNLHTSHMEKDKPGAGRLVTCVDCHSAIPHGWQRRAMLVVGSDPAPYNDGNASNSSSDTAFWPATGGFWPKSTCNNASCH